jgi:hypothetical protein
MPQSTSGASLLKTSAPAFDLGDHWRHRCVVERDKADPVKEYGHVPDRPVAIWGWGSIPDQYGRVSFDGDQDD